ncbi:hypothetical protein DIPPA_00562 [Diplonema papillatum]|nr:hypothetical protein DIPPA_00562 [Diplonema papillatum]
MADVSEEAGGLRRSHEALRPSYYGKCYISHVRTHSALNFQGMPAADQDYLKFVNQSLKRGAGEEDCWPIGTEMIGKLALAAVTKKTTKSSL